MARAKGKTALTPREELFIRHYAETFFNATESARRAGFKNPEHTGYELRKKPQVEKAISTYIQGLISKTDDKVAAMIRSLTLRAFYSVADILDSSGELIKPLSEMGELAQVVDGVETRPTKAGELYTIYRLANKDKSLDMLGKYLQMFTQRMELTGQDGAPLPGVVVQLPNGAFSDKK